MIKEYEVTIKLIIIGNNKEEAQTETEFIISNEPIFNNVNIETEIKETEEYYI